MYEIEILVQLPNAKKTFISHAHRVNHESSIFSFSSIWGFFWEICSQLFGCLGGGKSGGSRDGFSVGARAAGRLPRGVGVQVPGAAQVSHVSPVPAGCPGHRRLPGHRQRLPAPLPGHPQPAQRKQQVPPALPVPVQALRHVHGQPGRGDVLFFVALDNCWSSLS